MGKGNLSITRRGTSYVGFSGAVIGANWHFYGSQTGISDAVPTCGNISIGKGLTLNISEQTSGADAASIGGARGASCGNISIGSNANVTITRNTLSTRNEFYRNNYLNQK